MLFIIEKNIWDNTHIISVLKANDIAYKEIEYNGSLTENSVFNNIETNQPIISRGSFQFINKLKEALPTAYPGYYADYHKYNCTNYIPRFSDRNFNKRYIMLPIGDLNRRRTDILTTFRSWGFDNTKVFIRPNASNKPFAGQTIELQDNLKFHDTLKHIMFYEVDDSLLVLIAPIREIKEEYRILCSNKKVLSATCYMKDNILIEDNSIPVPQRALELAESTITIYKPDSLFILDICKGENDVFYNLEAGSFSCASLYGMPLNNCINDIVNIVENDYKEIFS